MPYRSGHVVETVSRPTGTRSTRGSRRSFNNYRKTHNDGVFDAYTTEIRAACHSHIITELPDSYGCGRIITTGSGTTGSIPGGVFTLRHNTRLHHIGVGRRHAGTESSSWSTTCTSRAVRVVLDDRDDLGGL